MYLWKCPQILLQWGKGVIKYIHKPDVTWRPLGGLVKISLPLIRGTQEFPWFPHCCGPCRFKPTYSFFFSFFQQAFTDHLYIPGTIASMASPCPGGSSILVGERQAKRQTRAKELCTWKASSREWKVWWRKGDKEMWGGGWISPVGLGSSPWQVTSDWDLNDQPDGVQVWGRNCRQRQPSGSRLWG